MEKISITPDWVFSPQPMYIIGTKNENGTPNFCIITWLGFSFDKTPHLMMTIGGSKLTKTNILRDKKFSANMITEDNLWLGDYFGNTQGEDKLKDEVSYSYKWGEVVAVPIIEECHWVYECEVTKVIELDGAHLFLADIKNIQIDKKYEMMDMKKIDLTKLKPAIYAPYNYFSIGEKLGEMGEWEKHLSSGRFRYVHTNLIAKDADKLITFYKEIMHCKSINEKRDLSGEWLDRLTALDKAHITGEHLLLPGHGEDHPTLEIFSYNELKETALAEINRPGFAHLAFEVDDVETTLAEIMNAGGSSVGEVVTADYPDQVEAVFVYARDPEGNIIELQSWRQK